MTKGTLKLALITEKKNNMVNISKRAKNHFFHGHDVRQMKVQMRR